MLIKKHMHQKYLVWVFVEWFDENEREKIIIQRHLIRNDCIKRTIHMYTIFSWTTRLFLWIINYCLMIFYSTSLFISWFEWTLTIVNIISTFTIIILGRRVYLWLVRCLCLPFIVRNISVTSFPYRILYYLFCLLSN